MPRASIDRSIVRLMHGSPPNQNHIAFTSDGAHLRNKGLLVTNSWTCPTCNSELSTPYCAMCGERPPSARDLTLRGLFSSAIPGLQQHRWTAPSQLSLLVGRPGALTVAYVQGRRIGYLKPFQLFFIANLMFFAVQSLTNTNIVSSTLDSHLHTQDWHAVAQRLVSHRLETLQTTLNRYAPIFDQAILLHAKSFIILMVLPLALLLPALFHRNRQPFVAHAVFSLHFYAFLLLLFCVSLAFVAANVQLGGAGLNSARMDNVLSGINLAASATYLYLATGTVYGVRRAIRTVKALPLSWPSPLSYWAIDSTIFADFVYDLAMGVKLAAPRQRARAET